MNRRSFVKRMIHASGVLYLSGGLAACKSSLDSLSANTVLGTFKHGIASGDPLSESVIIWTRITVDSVATILPRHVAYVTWQVALDPLFNQVVVEAYGETQQAQDFTLKVDVQGLQPNTRYFYRFLHNDLISVTGTTKTLAVDRVDQVKLLVVSCSKYDAGYYYVCRAALSEKECDAVLHVGDYIYEYGAAGALDTVDGEWGEEREYASEHAEALGRVVEPTHAIVSLDDYRRRHAQNKTDSDLQNLHAALPFIFVWDDHDIADNAWRDGAENHHPEQGAYADRVTAAMKAYHEWTPLRPPTDQNIKSLVRQFKFGDLVNLLMLESRIIARDKQLDYNDFYTADGNFETEKFKASLFDVNRKLIGDEQLYWIDQQLAQPATWHVIGQQVLMGKQWFPVPVLQKRISIFDYVTLAKLAQQAKAAPHSLTSEQWVYLTAHKALLDEPFVPYNLDTWDGYPLERSRLLGLVAKHNNNVVVLTGDSHNAWANNLTFDDNTSSTPVGVEFGTSSITSPGFERSLNLDSDEKTLAMESAFYSLLPDTQYCNINQRGYLTTTYTKNYVEATYVFVDSVLSQNYHVRSDRGKTIRVAVGSKSLP